MKIKDLIDVDLVNYKVPSMFISTYTCDFKCDRECGKSICQNSPLAKEPTIEMDNNEIIERYFGNCLTQAIVFGGLEPLDDVEEIFDFLCEIELYLSKHPHIKPIIVIYTGYTEDEIKGIVRLFSIFNLKIVFKVGRFIPDQEPHYDKLLGIKLASDNQYGIRLEDMLSKISTKTVLEPILRRL